MFTNSLTLIQIKRQSTDQPAAYGRFLIDTKHLRALFVCPASVTDTVTDTVTVVSIGYGYGIDTVYIP